MQAAAISDLTMRSLATSMQALSQRRRAHQDNIANVETPGFLANEVSFEQSLADAIRSGRPESTEVGMSKSTEPTNLNGNNVEIDEEFVGLTQTSLASQLVTEALNSKYRLLRTSIAGQ